MSAAVSARQGTYQTLEIERRGRVARIWLARPDVHNALDAATLEELIAACHRLQVEFDVPVVVIGGRGPSFSSGADRRNPPARIARDAATGARERRYVAQLGRRVLEAIERLEAITIARLHGHVIGAGVVLALGCDLRVAGTSARFAIPEVDLGIPLTWGAVPRLVREVGAARAKELILLCDRIAAAEAWRLGLVNRVVDDADLDAVVDDWADRLAAKAPWALHMTKTQFRAYGRTAVLGDVTEGDGDLLAAASAEDPGRFALPPRRDPSRDRPRNGR
jgi:enoyl-CoA hydratase/carnithine racemase